MADFDFLEFGLRSKERELKKAQIANLLDTNTARAKLLDLDASGALTSPTPDYMQPAVNEYQRHLENQAFPDARLAAMQNKAVPPAPSMFKYGPGDVGVMQGTDPATGQPFARSVFSAPFAPKVQSPESPYGKLSADLKAGFIDQPTYEAGVAKEKRIPDGPKASSKWAFDRKVGQNVSVTDDQVNAEPTRYAPPITPPTVKLFSPDGQEAGTGDPNDPEVQARIKSGEVRTGTPKSFNNDQNKAAGFGNTMADAEGRISGIGDGQVGTSGFKPFDPTTAWEATKGKTNLTASPKYQKYKQAALDWTLAVLRQESGANVPDAEAEKYWTNFFPQYGDSEEVIAQKAASRQSKMQGVVAASGGAFDALRKGANKAAPATNIPDGAIAALRSNPQRAAEFDAKFGPGTAKKYLSGTNG